MRLSILSVLFFGLSELGWALQFFLDNQFLLAGAIPDLLFGGSSQIDRFNLTFFIALERPIEKMFLICIRTVMQKRMTKDRSSAMCCSNTFAQ